VNQQAARETWPGGRAIGQRVRGHRQSDWCDIVGVAGDIRHRGLESDVRAEVYFPALQQAPARLVAVARTPDPALLLAQARAQTASLTEPAVVERVIPFTDLVDRDVRARKTRAVALSALGAIGTLLAAVGIFGLTSFAVARKTAEFGIRIALGATRRRVLSDVLRGFAPAIAGGIGLGLAGALAVTRVLESFLYGVTPTDPITFTILPTLLTVVAFAACYLPARAAASVDPLRAFRCE
jgi:hypothetical protein